MAPAERTTSFSANALYRLPGFHVSFFAAQQDSILGIPSGPDAISTPDTRTGSNADAGVNKSFVTVVCNRMSRLGRAETPFAWIYPAAEERREPPYNHKSAAW